MPALVLFAVGLLARLLFVTAGPDGGPGWHIGFQGDAPVWQSLAQKLAHGQLDDELRLPWRPPGMTWLVAALWDGEAARVTALRTLMACLGASVAPLLWLWLRRHVAPPTALLAAGLCAVSSNQLLLSSGLHVEIVYLPGVLLTLLLQERLVGPRRFGAALAWGALHGLLCLLRAEHLLTLLALAATAKLLGVGWRTLGCGLLAATATITPWQLRANAMVDAYNAGAPALPPAALPWGADAVARLRTLPAVQQLPTYGFVTATLQTRGAARVTAADLDVLREAYGCWPEPIPHQWIASYGGLNFFLANSAEANGGFSRAALDRAPPLLGGDHRYPPGLRDVLPRGVLAFSYPPHLDAVVHGTSRGLAEIRGDVLGWLGRVARKLWHAAQGACVSLGGYALPIGLSGTRRPVDLVTATGAWPTLWCAFMSLVAALGLWRLRTHRALWPLAVFALTKLVVIVGWFGYARQGALCLPLVALGLAAWAPARLDARRLGYIALTLLALEALRARGGGAAVDGQPVVRGEPFGAADFEPRRVEFR